MQDETGKIISFDLRARVTSLQVPGVALKGMPRKSSSESPRRAVKTVHPRCDSLIIVRAAFRPVSGGSVQIRVLCGGA